MGTGYAQGASHGSSTVSGAANAALISLLAERLQIPHRSISIVRGETNRKKTVQIADMTPEEIEKRLDTILQAYLALALLFRGMCLGGEQR